MNQIKKNIRFSITIVSVLWSIFILFHILLKGKIFIWNFFGNIPTVFFVIIPLIFLMSEFLWKKKKLFYILLAVFSLILGSTQLDINISRLKSTEIPSGAYKEIKVFTMNTYCWGQRSQHREKDYFYTYLKKQKADIYILQEYVNYTIDWSNPAVDKSSTDVDKSRLCRICTLVPGFHLQYLVIDDLKRLKEEFPGYYIKINQQFVIISRFPINDMYDYSEQYAYYDVDIYGKVVRFFNIHFVLHVIPVSPLKPVFYRALKRRFISRQLAFRKIKNDMKNTTTDYILLGDFNSTKTLGFINYLQKDHIDAVRYTNVLFPRTFEYWGLRLWRFDYTFVRKTNKDMKIKSYTLIDHEGLSDHLSQSLIFYIQTDDMQTDDNRHVPENTIKEPLIHEETENNGQEKNTPFNIGNGGLAAISGDWIYYTHIKEGWKLYKMKTDGSSITKINDDISGFINVIGEWIYYTNFSDIDKIYKIKTDGSNKTKINNEVSWDINVVDDWIYYINESCKLYKMKTDGSRRTRITDDLVDNIIVRNNWIYYITYSEDNKLYKISIDGKNKTKITDDCVSDINVTGDWIYYSNHSDNWNLYKIRVDGRTKVKICNDRVSDINVAGNWIYYCNRSHGWKLYKITLNGDNNVKLSDDSAGSINIAAQWVYYRKNRDTTLYGQFYRTMTDGSHRTEVDFN
jgi:hypothetical protein